MSKLIKENGPRKTGGILVGSGLGGFGTAGLVNTPLVVTTLVGLGALVVIIGLYLCLKHE